MNYQHYGIKNNIFLTLTFLISIILILNCNNKTHTYLLDGDFYIEKDKENPRIGIILPISSDDANNEDNLKKTIYSGKILIQGYASDDRNIDFIEIKINNGNFEKIEGKENWFYSLDADRVEAGEKTITARVTDKIGKTSEASIQIETNYNIYVSKTNGSDINKGNVNKPVLSLTKAVEIAEEISAEHIYIEAGTYNESIKYDFSLSLHGSYNSSFDKIDLKNTPTIINGTDEYAIGLSLNQITNANVIENLIINDNPSNNTSYGIYCVGGASPNIKNNIIYGGKVLNNDKSCMAIALLVGSFAIVEKNYIYGGTAVTTGNNDLANVAIHMLSSIPTIRNNVILTTREDANNVIDSSAIGMGILSYPRIVNNLIISTQKSGDSFGIVIGDNCETIILNNIFTNVYESNNFVSVYKTKESSEPSLLSCNLFFNINCYVLNHDMSCLNPLNEDEQALISQNNTQYMKYNLIPFGKTYTNLSEIFISNTDFHLKNGSNAIDNGIDASDIDMGNVIDDFEGNKRNIDIKDLGNDGNSIFLYDIGPYEYQD